MQAVLRGQSRNAGLEPRSPRCRPIPQKHGRSKFEHHDSCGILAILLKARDRAVKIRLIRSSQGRAPNISLAQPRPVVGLDRVLTGSLRRLGHTFAGPWRVPANLPLRRPMGLTLSFKHGVYLGAGFSRAAADAIRVKVKMSGRSKRRY